MNQQQAKQERQTSLSSVYKQGQQYGHRKNFSQQIDSNKDVSNLAPQILGTPNSKDSKQMFTTAKVFDTPNTKKNMFSYDSKQAKSNTSLSNLRNILTSSHGQALPNTTQISQTPPSIPFKSNYGISTPNKSLLLNQYENNNNSSMLANSQNQTVQNAKEFESQPLSPIEEVHINNIKKMPPLTAILTQGKIPTEIPRSTFNFNIDNIQKKQLTPQPNYSPKSNQLSYLLQKQGIDAQIQPQGLNKIFQQPQNVSQQNQQNTNYFQKSSYTSQIQNQTPSTTLLNTQSISNIQNKTNPILQNYQLQLQQVQQQQYMQQQAQQQSQYSQQYQQFQKQPSIQEQVQIQGATLTESQNTQQAQNANQTIANQSGVSSITNISNFIQTDNPSQSALKSEGQIQATKAINIAQRETYPVRKEERSLSKDQNAKKESPTRSQNRKDSNLLQSQSSSRSNSQNQKTFQKNSISINLNVVNQQQNQSGNKNIQDQNTSPFIKNIASSTQNQNYEESRKHSAIPSYLGVKNTNINLTTLTNSLTLTNPPPQQNQVQIQGNQLQNYQNQSLNNSANSNQGARMSDAFFQNQGGIKSQFRKESLIVFQVPQYQTLNSQKQLSKQASSVLLADSEEGSVMNQSMRNPQRSQTQLNQSPGRERIPIQLQKTNSTSQKSIQEIMSSSPKLIHKRNTEIYSPSKNQDRSPNKSLFQMVRLSMQASENQSPLLNSSQKINRQKRRNQSYLNLPSDTSGNVKTFLRFRPNNQMELDLNGQGLGQNIINFIDDFSVSLIGEQQQAYTVDKVFRSYDTQELIYQTVGQEVIEDVFLGYNGTIFTYGVTGSGKTHTMFGNITDQLQKGIIPRISNQIFDLVENDEEGTEFIINCSMLEIYKEILYDSFQEGKQELKIKENAQKGIYVQGLTQTSVASQDELVQLIQIGYNTKRTRETRLNEYSSRSHTIFMIEIQQRLSNGDEKVGKINLIDLAGAEKVSRSGAQGESLEEAIKINLSLSCLGKVIHSLTSGNEYIPYRDSKLTRILQESLGGNYKVNQIYSDRLNTSLIVTCSPHSSFQDDTISSLKFATRAKTIKNIFKMNIKVNPINLQKELENLKMQTESYKYMLQNVKTIFSDAQNKISSLPNISSDPKLSEIKNKLDEFLTLQNMIEDISGVSNQDITYSQQTSSNLGAPLDNKYLTNFLSTKKDLQKFYQKKQAIMMIKDENIKQLQQINSDQSEQIQQLSQEIQELKKENLNLTVKVNELSQEKNQLKLKLNKQLSKNDYSTFSLEILQKQIQHLVDSVCGAEKKISQFLLEKKNILDVKFEEYLKEKLTFSEIKLADYFKNSINFNFESAEKGYKDVQQNLKKFYLDGEDDFMAEKSLDMDSSYLFDGSETLYEVTDNNLNSNPNTLNAINQNKNTLAIPNQRKQRLSNSNPNNSFVCNIDSKLFQNENNDILKKIFAMPSKLDMISVSDTVSTDFIIVSLKKQLIDSHILNQNLLRTVNALEWKQIIEYGKSKLKSDQIHIQKKQIKHLEKVLEEVTENHKELRVKIEDLEFDMYQQAHTKPVENNIIDIKKSHKNKIIIPLTPQNAHRSQLLGTDNKKSTFGDVKQSLSKTSLSNIPTLQKDLFEIQQSFVDLELDIIPLTYENALEELKKRNVILKKLGELNLLDLESFEAQAPQREPDEFIRNERDRLNNKIIILQQELKMEQVKVESFKHSLLIERKNVKDLKQLTEDMEVSLRNNLKEENESWQKTINEVSEQNKMELTRRQAEYNQLKEIFYNIVEFSLQKVQELKHRWQSQELQELENIIIEMDKAKLQIGKSYEKSMKQRKRNSSIHSMAILTPKRPLPTLELNGQKSLQQS